MQNFDDYKKIDSQLKYAGLIMKIYVDKVQFPNGEVHLREIVKKRSAAATLPIDEFGDILLVSQYRHPIYGMALEIPAGLIEPNESPIAAARRELEEEIGYYAQKVEFLCKTHPVMGFADEMVHIYLATDLQKTQQNFDSGELIEVHSYSLEECLQMVDDGKITDSKTIIALLKYQLKRGE